MCGSVSAQPHLAWVFPFQGANQNLSAFSTARLDAARISRDSSEKSPCTTCIPAASGLGFGLQGANQNLSAFSTARLDASLPARYSGSKSPCPTSLFPPLRLVVLPP